METVAASPRPWLFVAEAAFLYLPAEQVRDALSRLASWFLGSLLALDTGGPKMLASMKGEHLMGYPFQRISRQPAWRQTYPTSCSNCRPTGVYLTNGTSLSQAAAAREVPLHPQSRPTRQGQRFSAGTAVEGADTTLR